RVKERGGGAGGRGGGPPSAEGAAHLEKGTQSRQDRDDAELEQPAPGSAQGAQPSADVTGDPLRLRSHLLQSIRRRSAVISNTAQEHDSGTALHPRRGPVYPEAPAGWA